MKCRYCYRTLRMIPHSPAEIEPHCAARGCTWCVECHAGETLVSPVTHGGKPRRAPFWNGDGQAA